MTNQHNVANSEWAVLLIDMENGFVDPASPHCIRMAEATIPAIQSVLLASRNQGVPIFYIKRIYRPDGSDVELTRWQAWSDGGRAMGPSSQGVSGAQYMTEIMPQQGDYLMNKSRWSSFFATPLDLILRRLGVKGVILMGTTTPNCIRTTAYDANSLDYEVIVIADGTSSQTSEIQQANLSDMERMGASILTAAQFTNVIKDLPFKGWVERIREDRILNHRVPEPIGLLPEGGTGWTDRW